MAKIDHIKLEVGDWRASRDWYVKNLGLKVEFQLPEGGPHHRGVAALQDDVGLTLFLEQVPPAPVTCGCVHYFQVDDRDAKYDELSAAGVTWIQTPQKVHWGYGAIIADPDGHVLYLWDEKSMKQNDSSD